MPASPAPALPEALARGAELELRLEVSDGAHVVVTGSRFPGVAVVSLARQAFGTTATSPEVDVDTAALDAVLVALLDRPEGLAGDEGDDDAADNDAADNDAADNDAADNDAADNAVALTLRASGRIRWQLRCARDLARGVADLDAAVIALLKLAEASDAAAAAEASAAWKAA